MKREGDAGGEPATEDPGFEDRDPWHTATADDKQAADDERAAADQQAAPDSQAGADQPAGAGSPAGADPQAGAGSPAEQAPLAPEAAARAETTPSAATPAAATEPPAAPGGTEPPAAPAGPAPVLRAAAPPTHLSGPVPAAAPAPLPDGLPEHWPGREAIHEPPHPGYREVAAPAPRPVRPAPARPRRQAPPPGTDLINGFQRWVIRSSARSMRREIEHSVRRTIGSARAEPEDTWGVATTEPPPDLSEAPECAWCPVCRAARRMRESGRPGLASVSDAVAAAVQDAFGALDGVLSRTTAATGHERPAESRSRYADSAGDHDHAEAPDEPGDRG